MFQSILIVCSGNICRSPMAEGLLRSKLPVARRVASAGITALVGYPAEPTAVAICKAAGLDISGHRAQQVTLPLLTSADLILAMDQSHYAWLTRAHPELRGRIHKWLRWRANADVPDPFLRGRDAFEKAFADIQLGIDDWVRRVG